MKTAKFVCLGFALTLLVFSCSEDAQSDLLEKEVATQSDQITPKSIVLATDVLKDKWQHLVKATPQTQRGKKKSNKDEEVEELAVVLAYADLCAAPGSEQMGQRVFFSNVGNRQLAYDFLAGDPRSLGGDLTVYAVDQVDGATASGLSGGVTEAAIDRAMNTWDAVNCSELGMVKNVTDTDFGFFQALLGFGGSFEFFYGDVQHAGWLPREFFDGIAPSGGDFILGVAFTFLWLDDLNADGDQEVAFREIYYNDAFFWQDGDNIDVETVALHEAGHGLSQAHFGTLFQTVNGKFHFSPRAVMNAGYTGVQTEIGQSDNAGHCSLWSNWPIN